MFVASQQSLELTEPGFGSRDDSLTFVVLQFTSIVTLPAQQTFTIQRSQQDRPRIPPGGDCMLSLDWRRGHLIALQRRGSTWHRGSLGA